ncbi:MAG: oxidoreductase [Parcubacteria group bacterium Gr01-1014_106]|nr:MAG: oxidoreductase [Parcubacteria group bacterium Gr01-1014_106]
MTTLALIGRGRWGTNIQRTLAQLPGCSVSYVETRDWKRLLQLRDLDGVLIATPGSTHADIALPFIERGMSTFIEKPLTTNLRDALRLENAAKKSGARVFVGHVHLYNPAYKKAKTLARRAGALRFLFAEGMNNGPYRDDMSALWDWASHDLAMTLDLLGVLPRTVRATGISVLRPRTKLYDVATLHLEFPGGVHFFGQYSWMAPEKRKRFVVQGSRHTVIYDDVAERKVTLLKHLGPTVRGHTIERHAPIVAYPSYRPTSPLTEELRAFVQYIRTGKRPSSDLAQGVQVVRILDAAERSIARRGSAVSL